MRCTYINLPSDTLFLLPVLGDPDDAAVVLVSPEVVLHAGVDDVAHGDLNVVGAEVLQEVHHLPGGGHFFVG
jgi:hypothetical protein